VKTQSKQQFILSQGDMPADQVVKAAKAAGLKISRAYVYVARSNAKRGLLKPSGRTRTARAPEDLRQAFAKLALRIGLDRASAELDRLRGGLEVV
jgi:hypothetical protein